MDAISQEFYVNLSYNNLTLLNKTDKFFANNPDLKYPRKASRTEDVKFGSTDQIHGLIQFTTDRTWYVKLPRVKLFTINFEEES